MAKIWPFFKLQSKQEDKCFVSFNIPFNILEILYSLRLLWVDVCKRALVKVNYNPTRACTGRFVNFWLKMYKIQPAIARNVFRHPSNVHNVNTTLDERWNDVLCQLGKLCLKATTKENPTKLLLHKISHTIRDRK